MNRLDQAVRAFKKGDEAAFDTIYELTRSDVYYTALLIVKDESLAEDILQETYLKMVDNLSTYQERGRFRAWIRTIAKRLAINAYHQQQRDLSVDASQTGENLFGGVEDQAEDRRYLEELFQSLDATEQEIVIRRAVLQEKHRTIAKKLDLPIGTVTYKYKRSLEKLREAAAGKEGEET